MAKSKKTKPKVKKTAKKVPAKKKVTKKTPKKTSKTTRSTSRVKPKVRKSLDSLKEDLYGIKTAIEEDTPEKRKIQLQTIVFELAAIKQLMDRVSTQLKTIEEHIEEIQKK